MKLKAKLMSLFLALLLLLLPALSACRSEPPALEEVQERFWQLIEDSAEINTIFFGEGLATYSREDPEFESLYYSLFGVDAYEIVAGSSPYQSVEQIKAAAENVYTPDYLNDIYTMAFDGYADDNFDTITTARYIHNGEYLLRYAFGETDPFHLMNGRRIYLKDTMAIGPLSSGKAVNLQISSYLEGEPDNIHTETLRFLLVNDEWLLDEPTY